MNPFRSSRLESLEFDLRGDSWSAVMDRFALLGRRAATLGRHGSGKTTFLEQLARRLEGVGLEVLTYRLDDLAPRLDSRELRRWQRQLTAKHLVVVDGAGWFGPVAGGKLLRATLSAGGLLVSAHRRCRLPVLFECRTDGKLLQKLVETLLRDCVERVPPGLLTEVASAYERHRGNLRHALRDLYDQWPSWQRRMATSGQQRLSAVEERYVHPLSRCVELGEQGSTRR